AAAAEKTNWYPSAGNQSPCRPSVSAPRRTSSKPHGPLPPRYCVFREPASRPLRRLKARARNCGDWAHARRVCQMPGQSDRSTTLLRDEPQLLPSLLFPPPVRGCFSAAASLVKIPPSLRVIRGIRGQKNCHGLHERTTIKAIFIRDGAPAGA